LLRAKSFIIKANAEGHSQGQHNRCLFFFSDLYIKERKVTESLSYVNTFPIVGRQRGNRWTVTSLNKSETTHHCTLIPST